MTVAEVGIAVWGRDVTDMISVSRICSGGLCSEVFKVQGAEAGMAGWNKPEK